MQRVTVSFSLRVPPQSAFVLDPEDDQGGCVGDWESVEPALLSILHSSEKKHLSRKEKGILVQGLLSPDERERTLIYSILEECVCESLVDRNSLVSLVLEYLLGDIPHYGIDLALSLINQTNTLSEEEVQEVYIPLLAKNTSHKIRREVIIGVVDVFKYSTASSVLSPLLKQCRVYTSKSMLALVVIIGGVLVTVPALSASEASSVSQMLCIVLSQEYQLSVAHVADLFMNPDVLEKLSAQSSTIVKDLFPVVYKLSQEYWKRTDQILICQVLQSLFELNKSVFDLSLRRYNKERYVEKENEKILKDASKRV
ncbi:serine/threonine-protein phosphatase 2A regulatory subunit B' [Nematocida sp. AWRm77]|nr:serine/threonine-protein phosphatase 2A regulatory subunit B' [Nematocida sp. AWRm77]